MKPHIRYYNFWDKKITRCENKGKPLDATYRKQIKRSYDMGMITQEQYEELMARVDNAHTNFLNMKIYHFI